MSNNQNYYLLSESQLLGLLNDSLYLQALLMGGIDNWYGYNMSIADFIIKYTGEYNSNITIEDIAKNKLIYYKKEEPYESNTNNK